MILLRQWLQDSLEFETIDEATLERYRLSEKWYAREERKKLQASMSNATLGTAQNRKHNIHRQQTFSPPITPISPLSLSQQKREISGNLSQGSPLSSAIVTPISRTSFDPSLNNDVKTPSPTYQQYPPQNKVAVNSQKQQQQQQQILSAPTTIYNPHKGYQTPTIDQDISQLSPMYRFDIQEPPRTHIRYKQRQQPTDAALPPLPPPPTKSSSICCCTIM